MTESEKPQGAKNMQANSAVKNDAEIPAAPPPASQAAQGAQQAPFTQAPPTYQVPPQQNYAQASQGEYKTRQSGFGSAKKEKWPAVLLAFGLGSLGIHKFYLGYKTEGLVMLLVSIIGGLCFGIGTTVMLIFSIIEAVKYVSLTEDDFERIYVHSYKGWF